jgi:hypothetical protein
MSSDGIASRLPGDQRLTPLSRLRKFPVIVSAANATGHERLRILRPRRMDVIDWRRLAGENATAGEMA